ncbi:MAG: hypothetical protein ABIP36_06020 [Acidimicrobiales bacterium]
MFADRLEHLLLQRLTAAASSRGAQITGAADGSNQEGHITLVDIKDRPTGGELVNAGRHLRGRWLLGAAAAVVIAVTGTLLVAAGRDEKTVDTATSTPETTAATAPTSCRLTAEEVSQVIGVTVTGPESPTSCHFDDGPSIVPGVDFGYVPASSCTQESLREAGYLGEFFSIGAVDGLDIDTYAQRVSTGVRMIVCDGDQPFLVYAEIVGDDQAAAIALAKLVLNG